MRAFVTSDPHGCYEPFRNLIESAEVLYHPDYFIFLGDYIDNGTESYQVLKFLKDFQERRGEDKVIVLKGNHEVSLMYHAGHYHLSHSRNYLAMSDTMKSFAGVTEFMSFEEAKDVLDKNIPLLEWVDTLPTVYHYGNNVFSHTGADPDELDNPYYHVNLHPKFLYRVKDIPLNFIIGHINVGNFSEQAYPYISKNLIMLDTNAYRTGSMCGIYYDLEHSQILETLQKTIHTVRR